MTGQLVPLWKNTPSRESLNSSERYWQHGPSTAYRISVRKRLEPLLRWDYSHSNNRQQKDRDFPSQRSQPQCYKVHEVSLLPSSSQCNGKYGQNHTRSHQRSSSDNLLTDIGVCINHWDNVVALPESKYYTIANSIENLSGNIGPFLHQLSVEVRCAVYMQSVHSWNGENQFSMGHVHEKLQYRRRTKKLLICTVCIVSKAVLQDLSQTMYILLC